MDCDILHPTLDDISREFQNRGVATNGGSSLRSGLGTKTIQRENTEKRNATNQSARGISPPFPPRPGWAGDSISYRSVFPQCGSGAVRQLGGKHPKNTMMNCESFFLRRRIKEKEEEGGKKGAGWVTISGWGMTETRRDLIYCGHGGLHISTHVEGIFFPPLFCEREREREKIRLSGL